MRQRKQRDVAKENEFYLQLMQQALPIDTSSSLQANENTSTAVVATQNNVQTHSGGSNKIHHRQSHEKNGHLPNGTIANGIHKEKSHRKSVDKCKEQHNDDHSKQQHIEKHTGNFFFSYNLFLIIYIINFRILSNCAYLFLF